MFQWLPYHMGDFINNLVQLGVYDKCSEIFVQYIKVHDELIKHLLKLVMYFVV